MYKTKQNFGQVTSFDMIEVKKMDSSMLQSLDASLEDNGGRKSQTKRSLPAKQDAAHFKKLRNQKVNKSLFVQKNPMEDENDAS